MERSVSNILDKRAANICIGDLGEGTRFTIRYCGIKFRLRIRDLTTEQMIRISSHLAQLRDIGEKEEGTMFQALMDHIGDAEHYSRAIAIATGTRFERVFAKAILKLKPVDQLTLFNLVRQYSDPDAFFFIIALAKKTSLMKMKQAE